MKSIKKNSSAALIVHNFPTIIQIALLLVIVLLLVRPTLSYSDSHRTFTDNRGAITHTWDTRGNLTIIKDNTNREIGYRERFGDRIEIRDSSNTIRGYEKDDD